jgi:MEMO1 family protein
LTGFLAHVGRAFGDDFDIDDGVVSRMRERDEADLAHALAGDGPAWYDAVMRDGNARRVCGLQCIYSALRATEGLAAKAELLDYGYAHDDAGGIVTFSAIAAA